MPSLSFHASCHLYKADQGGQTFVHFLVLILHTLMFSCKDLRLARVQGLA